MKKTTRKGNRLPFKTVFMPNIFLPIVLGEDAPPEELIKQLNSELQTINDKMLKAVTAEDFGKVKKEFETLLEKAKDFDFVAISKKIEEYDTAVAQMKDIVEGSKMKLSDRDAYKLRKMVEDNHSEIVKSIQEKKELKFEFKAAAVHRTDNGTVTNAEGLDFPNTDNFEYDQEVALIRYPENFILTVIPNRQVDKVREQIIRKEQSTVEGAVALTAEGAVKPLLQFKFVRTTTSREKWAGRIEWTEEFEMDFEALFNAILDLFEQEVVRTWQTGIFNEMIANATTYVGSTLNGTLPFPNAGYAIIAAQSQLESLNFKPDVVVLNSSDLFPVMFSQNTLGDIKLTPYINTTNKTINGMRYITNNAVEPGKFLIGESSLYREQHSKFILRTGQYNDQLITNEYTAIGEVFSILSIADIHLPGWIYGDIAAIMDDLENGTPPSA